MRRERYRPAAWLHYVRRSLRRSRDHALTRGPALRSLGVTAVAGLAALVALSALLALRVDGALARAFLMGTGVTLLAGLFGLTAHLSLLVDEAGRPLPRINLANLLTLCRLVSIPALWVLLAGGRPLLALLAFGAGALTDVADGLVARLCHQRTPLGRMFDPIVDILFNLTLFGALHGQGFVPAWVLALVLARYGLLLAGGAALYIFRGPIEIQPTVLGKTSGVLTTLLVLALTSGALGLPHDAYARISPLLVIGIGCVEAVTIPMVLLIGWLNFRRIGRSTRELRRTPLV